jgi:citrate synthase
MDALRTAVSALGATDPDLKSNEPEPNRRKAIRMTAQFPTIVTAFHRIRNGISYLHSNHSAFPRPIPRLFCACN